MKILSDKAQEKIQSGMGAFANNKYIKSISNGMVLIMTPIIVGSIFTLLANFPNKTWTDFLTAHNLKNILSMPVNFTTNIMGLLAVFLIAYSLAEQFQKDGIMAGVLAIISFFIISPIKEIKDGSTITKYIPFDWLGAKGLFVAIITGLITARVYVFLINRGITIKMPDSVPPAVSRSFTTLIPGFVTSILALIVAVIFSFTPFKSFNQMIYTCLQIPLEGLSGSYGSMLIVIIAIGILWFFGLHGTIIVFNGIMSPIYLAMDMQNLAAFQAGGVLPHIIGYQFFRCYIFCTGTGLTVGLTLLMAFVAKSKQFKVLGRLALPTTIFNINEPITFGTPIVLNPVMILPYILAPLLSGTIAYGATAIGLVPRLNGVQIPWPTPIILSGLMEGSWRIAVLQVFLVVVSLAVYYIPFKYMDKKNYAQEHAEENSTQSSESPELSHADAN